MKNKCVIIGAGPAGMAAALYLKRGGLDVLVIEKEAPGGEMLKTSNIENYLGFSSINGADLAMKMYEQLVNLDVKFLFKKVNEIIFEDNFKLILDDEEISADNVILATGRTPNKLNLPKEEKFISKGISYCAICDGAFYRNKEVAVVGAGNTAITDALYLSDICKKVYIIVRSKIKADNILKEKIKEKENIILINGNIKEIKGTDNFEGIVLDNDIDLNVAGLFVAIGGRPNIEILKNLNCKVNNGYLVTDKNCMTNIKGLYAAGDIIDKDFYQISTAINDGVVAALSIIEK